MRPLLIAVVASLFFAALLWGEVPQTASSGAATKAASPSVTATDHDNGKDIDLGSNETLILKLSSNPSTGYKWTVVGDPAPLKLEKQSYRKNTKSSPAIGAPGVQVFQFNASSAGMATLNLAYRRSWEYNVPPVKSFSVRVNVR